MYVTYHVHDKTLYIFIPVYMDAFEYGICNNIMK